MLGNNFLELHVLPGTDVVLRLAFHKEQYSLLLKGPLIFSNIEYFALPLH